MRATCWPARSPRSSATTKRPCACWTATRRSSSMVDTDDDEPQTAIKQLPGGPGRLVHWLTTLFDRSSWQPGGIVIVGAGSRPRDACRRDSRQAVPVPVITQVGARAGAGARSRARVGSQHRIHRRRDARDRATAGDGTTKLASRTLVRRGGDDAGRRSGHIRGIAVARAGSASGARPGTRHRSRPVAHRAAAAPSPRPRPRRRPRSRHRLPARRRGRHRRKHRRLPSRSPSSRRRRPSSRRRAGSAARTATSGGTSAAARSHPTRTRC